MIIYIGAMFLIRFIVIMKYRALTSLQGHVLQSRRAGGCVFTIYTQSQTVNRSEGNINCEENLNIIIMLQVALCLLFTFRLNVVYSQSYGKYIGISIYKQ